MRSQIIVVNGQKYRFTPISKAVAPAPKERTFATKAERAAGNGFTCTCGRNDLRRPVEPGKSFHNTPAGVLHDLR